jgi:hypothetical protein
MKTLIAMVLARIFQFFFKDTDLDANSLIVQIIAGLILLAAIILCIAFLISMFNTFIRKRKR